MLLRQDKGKYFKTKGKGSSMIYSTYLNSFIVVRVSGYEYKVIGFCRPTIRAGPRADRFAKNARTTRVSQVWSLASVCLFHENVGMTKKGALAAEPTANVHAEGFEKPCKQYSSTVLSFTLE